MAISLLLLSMSAAVLIGAAAAPAKAPTTPPGVRAPATLFGAADSFLGVLSPEQREKTVQPFDSEERLNWHFVPRSRKGLSLKEMSTEQKAAALALLRAGLSAQGYERAAALRELENLLREMENGNPGRDPEGFYFTFFGKPSPAEPWGWRYEGHHISLNWTFLKGNVIADSPQFLGVNPARVPRGSLEGKRLLGPEEDLGRAFVKALSDAQRGEAVLSERAPSDILTGAQRKAASQEDRGIAYRSLTTEQQGLLLALIRQHADAQPLAQAEERLAKIRRAGLDGVRFVWMGGLEPGQGHYYRIQGPTFLIEYDNTQNRANHVHTVWRDFNGDFGADLLAEHYHSAAHDHGHSHK